MQKTISNVVYDTEKSQIVKKFTYGNFGETTGYEETLYITDKGNYFLYTNGGVDSKYPKESIARVSKDKAQQIIAK